MSNYNFLTTEQGEKIKDILPSINYIINNHQSGIKENDSKVDTQLNYIKDRLDKKLKIDCRDSYNYLVTNKMIIENLNNDSDNDEFSLFLFQLTNLKKEDDIKIAKNFVDCVTKLSSDANNLIEEMNNRQEKISNYFEKCKNTCIFGKLKNDSVNENEIIVCLDKCLNKVGQSHLKNTNEYLENLEKISKLI